MPKVGVGVLIFKNGKLLMARRTSELGNGNWGTGGGHLEFGETPEKAIKREIQEEYGIELKSLKFLCVCNIIKYGKHYINIGFTAATEEEPKIMEPEKFDCIDWFDIESLPEPLFEAVKLYLISYKTGKIYHSEDFSE
ncbi:MAG: NUDIX domain-containing protein [Candidatus Aenigmarchaeota archaeon]|nr:NUDIX domain-containing protein [Candidatus Aenigmarchaeota archaeon]